MYDESAPMLLWFTQGYRKARFWGRCCLSTKDILKVNAVKCNYSNYDNFDCKINYNIFSFKSIKVS